MRNFEKNINMRYLIIPCIWLIGCSTPERKLATIQITKPELLIEHCVRNYNPELKELRFDTTIINIDTILVDCDTIGIKKVPIEKTHTKTEITKEIIDLRYRDLLEINKEELIICNNDLIREKNKSKKLTRFLILTIGLLIASVFVILKR